MLANASIQNATTLEGLPLCAVFDKSLGLRQRFVSVPTAGSPLSRG